jgi:hypothetical protein
MRHALFWIEDEDAGEDVAGQALGADPGGGELLLAVARLGVPRGIPASSAWSGPAITMRAGKSSRGSISAVDPDLEAPWARASANG